MDTKQYEFEVIAPGEGRQATFNATVRIKVEKETEQSDVLHYIRSIQMKNDFQNGWMKDHAPNHGLEIRGGPRPIFADDSDRTSGVVAYEQDFRLSPRI